MYDLERFITAQEQDFEIALSELRAGCKMSHWIWYIFPQLAALGFSFRAKFYGLDDLDEARAYMDHRVLGPRYLNCVKALLEHEELPAEEVMGGAIDAKKLKSSLTLMLAAGGGSMLHQAQDAFFGGQDCLATKKILKKLRH